MGTYTTGLCWVPFPSAGLPPGLCCVTITTDLASVLCHREQHLWPLPAPSRLILNLCLHFSCASGSQYNGWVVPCFENEVHFIRNKAPLMLSAVSALPEAQ